MRGTIRALLALGICFVWPAVLAAQQADVRLEFSPRAGLLVPLADLGAINMDWSGTTTASPRAAVLIGVELTAVREGAPFALSLAFDVAPNAAIQLQNCPSTGSCSTRVAGGELILAGADALIPLFQLSGSGTVQGRIGAGARLYRIQNPCAPADFSGACSSAGIFTRNVADPALRLGLQARWDLGRAAFTAVVTDHISVWGPNPDSTFDRGSIQHDLASQVGVAVKLE